jgi:hypothetical protein
MRRKKKSQTNARAIKRQSYAENVNEFVQHDRGVDRRRRHLIWQNIDDAHDGTIDRVEATCDRPRRTAVLVRRRPCRWKDDQIARRFSAAEIARRNRETAIASANGIRARQLNARLTHHLQLLLQKAHRRHDVSLHLRLHRCFQNVLCRTDDARVAGVRNDLAVRLAITDAVVAPVRPVDFDSNRLISLALSRRARRVEHLQVAETNVPSRAVLQRIAFRDKCETTLPKIHCSQTCRTFATDIDDEQPKTTNGRQ